VTCDIWIESECTVDYPGDNFILNSESDLLEFSGDVDLELKLEGMEYFQGKRSASDYCDGFTKLVHEAGMTDRRTIASKFRRGLHRDVDEVISKDIGLVLDDPSLWYRKAKDYELVAKFNKAYYDAHASNHRGTYPFRTTAHLAASVPPSGTPPTTTKSASNRV
jgi:hypothetical protein